MGTVRWTCADFQTAPRPRAPRRQVQRRVQRRVLNRKLNSARRKTCLVWVGTFLEKKRLRPPRVPDLQRSTFALAWPWLPWSFARSANRSSARLNPTRILRWKKRKRTPEIGAPPSRTERGAKKNHPAL